MEQTPNLTLPYIMPSQAQKHVTHNEAIRMLDALVQISVLDRDLAAPPEEPAEGDRYLIATGATDGWSGRDGNLAAFQDGAWAFFAPRPGWLAWIADEAALAAFDGTRWAAVSAGSLSPAMLGINATADETTRLAVSSHASLFQAEEGSHRLIVSKHTTSDTASIILQTDHDGRAEIGLTGDDDLAVKVSQDGEVWRRAFCVTSQGQVLLPPLGLGAHPDRAVASRDIRERLTADRTYFVRPDGSDANNGLSDTAGGAFATVQKAVDVVFGAIDLGPHHVTIQLANGIYGESVSILGPHLGSGTITLAGSASVPANTVLAGASTVPTISITNGATLFVRNLELRGNNAITVWISAATMRWRGGIRLGATGSGSAHINVTDNGLFDSFGYSYAIVGDTARHINVVDGGIGQLGNGATIAVDGRSFSNAFATVSRGGVLRANGGIFSGTATGKRYDVSTNGVIFVASGAAFLPGNVNGTAATGGQYV